MRNASATEPTATTLTTRSEKRNFRPSSPLMAAPSRGRRGTSQMSLCISVRGSMVNGQWSKTVLISSPFTIHHLPLQQIDLVHEDRLAVAVERDDDAEADGGFGGGDDVDEDREDLSSYGVHAPAVLKVAREGDEVQVRRVQDELDGHEDDDDVAARQHPRHADREEQRPDDEELREVRVLEALPDALGPRRLKQEGERRRQKSVHRFLTARIWGSAPPVSLTRRTAQARRPRPRLPSRRRRPPPPPASASAPEAPSRRWRP